MRCHERLDSGDILPVRRLERRVESVPARLGRLDVAPGSLFIVGREEGRAPGRPQFAPGPEDEGEDPLEHVLGLGIAESVVTAFDRRSEDVRDTVLVPPNRDVVRLAGAGDEDAHQ